MSKAQNKVAVDGPRVIVALDFPSAHEALALARELDPAACRVKIGNELFTRAGPGLLGDLHELGFGVFLDLKYHDIPNTVARACQAAAEHGVWMLNVHAAGGARMLRAAREAVDSVAGTAPLLIAVTVLTSLEQDDLAAVGVAQPLADQALQLAQLSASAGLDGVVCSAHEAASLRAACGPGFCLVTPGVRPAGVDAGDQRRIMTPPQAVAAGSDYLVIGRPITAAPEPGLAVRDILASLNGCVPA